MGENNDSSYTNTLIFTTLTNFCAVLIFGLLVFDFLKPYVVFFLVFQLGLIGIIIYTILNIRKITDNKKKYQKILKEAVPTNISCPDYYVRQASDIDDTKMICKNAYITPDKMKKFTFRLNNNANNEITQEDINEVDIHGSSLFGGDKQSLQSVCENNLDKYFKHIPWTSVKPTCPY